MIRFIVGYLTVLIAIYACHASPHGVRCTWRELWRQLCHRKTRLPRAIVLCLALCTGCVGWSRHDTARELAFTGEMALDTAQSITIGEQCMEENPIVGMCGQRLAFYMPGMVIVHVVTSALLPPDKRRAWQWLTLGVEGSTVMANEMGGWGVGGKGKL